MRWVVLAVLAIGCRSASGGVETNPADARVDEKPASRAPRPGATCTFPDRITEDLTLAEGCVVDVEHDTLVENGKTLTLSPGVRLRFQPNAFLEVGHRGSRIVSRGTKDKPVVLTSASSSPRPGDWVGLVLDDAMGETTLEHTVIEWAGRPSHGGQGALTVFGAFAPGRVSLRDVTFRNNRTALVDLQRNAIFGAFERNRFVGNERSLRVRAEVLAGFGAGNELGDRIDVVGGTIERAGTFPKARLHVLEPIVVNGSLTLVAGTELRFAQKTWMEIGVAAPAELVARGALFTSDADKPEAGDWVGLVFGSKTRHAVVEGSTIEYAGAEEHGGDAAVTFVGDKSWQALDVTFSGVTFRYLRQAHFSSNGDGCDKALDPRHGIAWAGFLEPCR